jgi:hypothetical protein
MTEAELLQQIRLALGRKLRLFRNNVGQAWVGEVHRRGHEMYIKNPRVLHAGLCEGSSDLIGWKSITVTPDMVGRRVAVFTAIEAKSKTGRATTDQALFLTVVREAGGIAVLARSVEDAENGCTTNDFPLG